MNQTELDNATEPRSVASSRLVRAAFGVYHVWWRRANASRWTQTTHHFRARTDKEAESKLRRMFAGAGFSGMSLVAVEGGDSPNVQRDAPI